MGSSSSNGNGYIDVNQNINLINGRRGEKGRVYLGKNNLADFVFDHRFIYVDCPHCDHYKIYEWTKAGLKKFASRYYPISERSYLGYAYVKDVYHVAKTVSRGKEFSITSFNCKDWVEIFQKIFNIYKL